ncbi:hypothetical protein FQA39_LY16526 [Lamprigera yunnana]|nr:hypothetical protein FQA39_LY16526 [Lamprigera yunnana]
MTKSNVTNTLSMCLLALIANYRAICSAANVLAPMLSEFETSTMNRFNVDWLYLNKSVFYHHIYKCSFVQNKVVLFQKLIKKNESTLSNILDSYRSFYEEMNTLASKWATLNLTICNLTQNRGSQHRTDKKLFKTLKKILMSNNWISRENVIEVQNIKNLDAHVLSIVGDTKHISELLMDCQGNCYCNDCVVATVRAIKILKLDTDEIIIINCFICMEPIVLGDLCIHIDAKHNEKPISVNIISANDESTSSGGSQESSHSSEHKNVSKISLDKNASVRSLTNEGVAEIKESKASKHIINILDRKLRPQTPCSSFAVDYRKSSPIKKSKLTIAGKARTLENETKILIKSNTAKRDQNIKQLKDTVKMIENITRCQMDKFKFPQNLLNNSEYSSKYNSDCSKEFEVSLSVNSHASKEIKVKLKTTAIKSDSVINEEPEIDDGLQRIPVGIQIVPPPSNKESVLTSVEAEKLRSMINQHRIVSSQLPTGSKEKVTDAAVTQKKSGDKTKQRLKKVQLRERIAKQKQSKMDDAEIRKKLEEKLCLQDEVKKQSEIRKESKQNRMKKNNCKGAKTETIPEIMTTNHVTRRHNTPATVTITPKGCTPKSDRLSFTSTEKYNHEGDSTNDLVNEDRSGEDVFSTQKTRIVETKNVKKKISNETLHTASSSLGKKTSNNNSEKATKNTCTSLTSIDIATNNLQNDVNYNNNNKVKAKMEQLRPNKTTKPCNYSMNRNTQAKGATVGKSDTRVVDMDSIAVSRKKTNNKNKKELNGKSPNVYDEGIFNKTSEQSESSMGIQKKSTFNSAQGEMYDTLVKNNVLSITNENKTNSKTADKVDSSQAKKSTHPVSNSNTDDMSINTVFTHEDVLENDMDDEEHKVEAFKRFC